MWTVEAYFPHILVIISCVYLLDLGQLRALGYFFYYYQEKDLDWSASEVPLTLNLL